MEEKIKLLKKKVGALPGMPHFWQIDDYKTDKSEARNYMKKEELKKSLFMTRLCFFFQNIKSSELSNKTLIICFLIP